MRYLPLLIGVLLVGTFRLPAPPPSATVTVPTVLSYQGVVKVGTTPFTGVGEFKFAIIDTAGTTNYWSNSPMAGEKPGTAISLPVTNGLFSVLLGDTNLSMPAISPAIFTNGSLALRVWFSDGTNGSSLLTPDQRLGSAGYAMLAGSVADRGITADSIASSSITSDKLAPSDTFEVDAVGNVFAKRVFENWGTNELAAVDFSIPGYTNQSSAWLESSIDWAVIYEKSRRDGQDQVTTAASHFRNLRLSRTAFAESGEWRKWYIDVLNDVSKAKADVTLRLRHQNTILRTVILDNAFPVRWSLISQGSSSTEEIVIAYESISIQ